MKRASLLGIFFILLSACTGGESDNGPIKIGYIGPLTGDAAAYGVDTLNGVKMAIEERNAAGGVNGRMVELAVEDGRCTGADAASAAQKLVSVDRVTAIIGGQCSGETLAAAPITEAAETLLLSPLSSSPDVTEAGDFVFRNYPSDALKTKAMAKYFAEKGWKRVAMLSENTDFAMAFRAALTENLGKEAVVFDEVVEPGTKDFRTLALRLKDVSFDVFFPNAQGDAVMAAMVEQMRDQGLTQPMVTHDVGDSMTLVDLIPEAVSGMQVINVPSAGEGGEFETKYRAKFGDAQSTIAFAAHAYDAANVLMDSIAKVGTSGPRLRDALYDLPEHRGIVGRFSFNADGDVVGIPYVLKEFRDGKIVKVKDIAVD